MITATFVLLLAAGCGGAPAAPQSPASNTISTPTLVAAQPTSGVQPTNETGEKLVAKVNGEGITEPEFESELARKQQQVDAASPDALKTDVLDQLIQNLLTLQG